MEEDPSGHTDRRGVTLPDRLIDSRLPWTDLRGPAMPSPHHRPGDHRRRCRHPVWGWSVTISGSAVAFLAPGGQPGRFQLAEGGLDGARLERVPGLGEAVAELLDRLHIPRRPAGRSGPTGGTWTARPPPGPGPGRPALSMSALRRGYSRTHRGDLQHLGSPFQSAHTHRHDHQITS
jgi:hypothetical protein